MKEEKQLMSNIVKNRNLQKKLHNKLAYGKLMIIDEQIYYGFSITYNWNCQILNPARCN